MAGIKNGVPEVAVGEPIRFGDIDGFELEQHPVSDRLIIRDTANGTVAYLRKERNEKIGGDGTLVKALKEGKPMADDGRTHDSIQAAERAANGWVFVPPGTFTENVTINTDGLTLRGSGYNSVIDGQSSGDAITINSDNSTIENLNAQTTDNGNFNYNAISANNTRNTDIINIDIPESDSVGINAGTKTTIIGANVSSYYNGIAAKTDSIVTSCEVTTRTDTAKGIYISGDNPLISNNTLKNTGANSIDVVRGNGPILIGNRIISSGGRGIYIRPDANNTVVANNRVSDSGGSNITNVGTDTLLDTNVSEPSN